MPAGDVETLREDGRWLNRVHGVGGALATFENREDAIESGRQAALERGVSHVICDTKGDVAARPSYSPSEPTSAHDLYRRWIEDLWGGDPEVAHELVSDDFLGHWPDREVRGPEELAAVIEQTRSMFAGLTFTVQVGAIVEGDLVAGRWTGQGETSEGPATFFGNDILRIEHGRFAEYWTASSADT